MHKKIIFFDIDGTILTENTRIIPDSTKAAIKEARKNGHLTFINTGRTFGNIEKEIIDVGFDGFVCGCGTYIRVGDEVLLSRTLDKDTCRDIVHKLRDCKIEAVFEGLEDVYFDNQEIRNKELLFMKHMFKRKGLGTKKNWDSEDLDFDKLFIVYDEQSNIDEFRLFLQQDFDYIDRGYNRGEIVPKGFSKATGIQFLLDYYNIPIENAYAIGDSSNDLAMLQYVPGSIAMGKSDTCIYDIASFITKDIMDDGIWHALKHFEII